jgi:hypothetical protein
MVSDFILDTSRFAFLLRTVYQNVSLNDTITNTWRIRQYVEGSYGLLICDISQMFAWRNFVKEWKFCHYSQRPDFELWVYEFTSALAFEPICCVALIRRSEVLNTRVGIV